MKKILILLILSLSIFSKSFSDDRVNSIRFIALGHLYPMIDDDIRLKNLFKKINSYEPDYVFILGDLKLHKIEYLNKFKDNLNGKIFFLQEITK